MVTKNVKRPLSLGSDELDCLSIGEDEITLSNKNICCKDSLCNYNYQTRINKKSPLIFNKGNPKKTG